MHTNAFIQADQTTCPNCRCPLRSRVERIGRYVECAVCRWWGWVVDKRRSGEIPKEVSDS